MEKTNQSKTNKIKSFFKDEDFDYKIAEIGLTALLIVSTFQASLLWTGFVIRIFQ